MSRFLCVGLLTSAVSACSGDKDGDKQKTGDGDFTDDDFIGKVIYGEDDRLDLYQVQDQELLTLADSTAALIFASDLQQNGDVTKINTTKYANSFRLPLCESERFREQDTAAFCSGFLVAPRIMVTAGHCIQTQGSANSDCATARFVFGFNLPNQNSRPTSVPTSEVYKCNRIIKQTLVSTGADFSVVELDRDVLNHRPLALRRSGAAKVNDDLVVIGHPSGLPTKVAGGAKVRELYPAYLRTSLDTYGGNSGSAVFNSSTKEVEGILVRGEEDFVTQGNCLVSKRCAQNSCRGEDVTKISEVLAYVPAAAPVPEPEPVPAPIPPAVAIFKTISNQAIPDNNSKGLESDVVVDQIPNGRKVQVELNLTHTWRGDLVVQVTAPDGQTVVLSNRKGRSADHIIGTYGDGLISDQSLDRFSSVAQKGTWTLKVTDHAARDVGRLNYWALKFK